MLELGPDHTQRKRLLGLKNVDSGSLVVTENLQAAGLLAAVSEQATIWGTFKNVMALLRVAL